MNCDDFYALANLLDGTDNGRRRAQPFFAKCQAHHAIHGLNSAVDYPAQRGSARNSSAQAIIDHVHDAVQAAWSGQCDVAREQFTAAKGTLGRGLLTGKKAGKYAAAVRRAEVAVDTCKP